MAFDWKKTLAAVAPALATALGGPLAGVATKAISEAVLGKPDGDEAEIAAAIQSGGADALVKLKEANNQFLIRMRELDLDLDKLLVNAEVGDRANARQREAQTGDSWTMRTLAALVIGAFIAVVWAVLFGGSAVDGALAGTLIGYLSAKADQILSYYFGSSFGSNQKNALLHKSKPD